MAKHSSSWPNAFSFLAVALLLTLYFVAFADLDWSWQVRTGEIIVSGAALRVHDSFSYTIHGEQLHDFEWLYEVILYLAWAGWGMAGLKLLKVLVIFTPLALVVWRQQVAGVRWHGTFLSLLLALFILPPAWNLRPLFITTIGLLLLASLLRDHCTGRKPLPWWTVLVMLLWANMHPGVITGQGLLAGAIAWEWLNRGLRWNPPLERPALVRLTWVGGLAFLATFLCPDPIERLRYTFKPELAHPIMRIFVEMEPLYKFIATPPFGVALVYLLAGLVLLTVIFRFRHYRMWELALLGGTAFLANFASRGMMDWFLVMLAFGVPQIKELFAQAARRDRRRWWLAPMLRLDRRLRAALNSPLFALQVRWLAVAALALLLVTLVPALSKQVPFPEGEEWPVAALDHVEQANLSGRFFGPPDYGAYVGWRLKEKGLAYTDTRGFFFPPVLIEDSHFIPQLGPDWRRRLDRVLGEYHTDYFLLETEGARGKLWHALRGHVGPPLFLDDKSVLLSATQVRAGLKELDVVLARQ